MSELNPAILDKIKFPSQQDLREQRSSAVTKVLAENNQRVDKTKLGILFIAQYHKKQTNKQEMYTCIY